MLGQPGVPQHTVAGVLGLGALIDGEFRVGDRAEPYFMIAAA